MNFLVEKDIQDILVVLQCLAKFNWGFQLWLSIHITCNEFICSDNTFQKSFRFYVATLAFYSFFPQQVCCKGWYAGKQVIFVEITPSLSIWHHISLIFSRKCQRKKWEKMFYSKRNRRSEAPEKFSMKRTITATTKLNWAN